MKTLREIIQHAERNNVAIGHFNISNIAALKAVLSAAQSLELPVVIGVSDGEREYMGVHQVVALVKSLREEFNYPVFLNADHTYTVAGVKEAINAGFDSVIFDGAKLSLEENIKKTREVVAYARTQDREVLVEGELGYIGSSSKMLDEVPAEVLKAGMTTPEDAHRYVHETGVDLLAPSVGNLHGMLKGAPNPSIDTQRIADIRKAAGVPLVLHGGSGISDEGFQEAIRAGIAMVHISTEMRRAYRSSIEKTFAADPDELAPYRLMEPTVQAIQEVVTHRLKVFNFLN